MNARVLVLVGSIGLVLGAAMPWATLRSVFGTINITGLHGDGVFSGGIGLLLLVIALVRAGQPGQRYSVSVGIIAVIALLLVAYTIWSVSNVSTGAFARGDVGLGLWLSVAAAVVATAGGFSRTRITPGDELQPAEEPARWGVDPGEFQEPDSPPIAAKGEEIGSMADDTWID